MARQKNKILMFLFSLIPGAGQMYMGFMKQGLSLMTLFAALCAVGIWLDLRPLLFFAPIILLYSFFDATNKNAMDTEAFRKLEDHYLWGDDWMDFGEGIKESISRRDGKKAMGTVMYVVAACMVWSAVKYFADILRFLCCVPPQHRLSECIFQLLPHGLDQKALPHPPAESLLQ